MRRTNLGLDYRVYAHTAGVSLRWALLAGFVTELDAVDYVTAKKRENPTWTVYLTTTGRPKPTAEMKRLMRAARANQQSNDRPSYDIERGIPGRVE